LISAPICFDSGTTSSRESVAVLMMNLDGTGGSGELIRATFGQQRRA
jgi:hypothetical protein